MPYTRIVLALLAALSFSGCATLSAAFQHGGSPATSNSLSSRPAAGSTSGEADWAWRVSGDGAVRPLQVFSLRGKTYLQMRPGQLVPAVIVNGAPVPFVVSAPYVVIEGTPQRIDLLTDGYRAIVIHEGPKQMPAAPAVEPLRVQRDVSAVSADAPTPTPTVAPTVQQATARATDADTRKVEHAKTEITPQAAQAIARADTNRVWRVEPDQKLLSRALGEWGKRAGMRVVWRTQVDVPITGSAEYADDSFADAAARLLADASTPRYRFFYSIDGDTITVVTVQFHAS